MVNESMDQILQGFRQPVMSCQKYFDEARLSLSAPLLSREIMGLSRLMSLPEPPKDGELSQCFQDVEHSPEEWKRIEQRYKSIIEQTDDSRALERLVGMSEVRRRPFSHKCAHPLLQLGQIANSIREPSYASALVERMILSMFHITLQKMFQEVEQGPIKDLDKACFDFKYATQIPVWNKKEKEARLKTYRRDERSIRQRRAMQLFLYDVVRLILPPNDLYTDIYPSVWSLGDRSADFLPCNQEREGVHHPIAWLFSPFQRIQGKTGWDTARWRPSQDLFSQSPGCNPTGNGDGTLASFEP